MSYTVNLEPRNGGSNSSYIVEDGQPFYFPTEKPVKAGKYFYGWADDPYTTIPKCAAGDVYTAGANKTFYGLYSDTEYHAFMYRGDGSPIPMTQFIPSSQRTATVSSQIPIKANTSPTSITLTFDKVKDAAVISGSATVTASVYKTFTFEYWKSNITPKTIPSGVKVDATRDRILTASYAEEVVGTITFPTCTLTNFKFLGWCDDKDGKGNWYGTGIGLPDRTMTLYAVYERIGTGGVIQYPAQSTPITGTVQAGYKLRLVGFKDSENDGVYTVEEINEDENYVTIIFVEPFVVSGSQETEDFTFEIYKDEGTYVPDLDFICGHNNRLWGCSSRLRTIFASALGEPADFYRFQGDALDSYAVAVASAGAFTGMISLNNTVLITKQHCVHKLMGGFPAEYTLYTYETEGTSETNGLSMKNCDGRAVFVAEHGIGMFTGAQSTIISTELGEQQIHDAIAEFTGDKYILHFRDGNNDPKTYIYDFRYGVWTQQDVGDSIIALAHMGDADYAIIQPSIIASYEAGEEEIDEEIDPLG